MSLTLARSDAYIDLKADVDRSVFSNYITYKVKHFQCKEIKKYSVKICKNDLPKSLMNHFILSVIVYNGDTIPYQNEHENTNRGGVNVEVC